MALHDTRVVELSICCYQDKSAQWNIDVYKCHDGTPCNGCDGNAIFYTHKLHAADDVYSGRTLCLFWPSLSLRFRSSVSPCGPRGPSGPDGPSKINLRPTTRTALRGLAVK